MPQPEFWRDHTLPFLEARSIKDARNVCYAKHVHETFSIGVISGGRSTYLNGKTRERVGPGAVVVINPGDVHVCNPRDDTAWSYRMLYVDATWLAGVQHDLGFSPNQDFRPFATTLTNQPRLYHGFNHLYDVLTTAQRDPLHKQSLTLTFFSELQRALDPAPASTKPAHRNLARAADYIKANCKSRLKLEDICAAAALSPSYLIRSFKARYGMTPHAYLINCRVEYSRAQLRRGRPIATVALEAGFSDQAHLQRAFRKLVAATPGQYRG